MIDMVLGHERIAARAGMYVLFFTVESFVVVYCFLRLSNSGYGVNSHMVWLLSQSFGWKYPTP